jgi:hypothetical protein
MNINDSDLTFLSFLFVTAHSTAKFAQLGQFVFEPAKSVYIRDLFVLLLRIVIVIVVVFCSFSTETTTTTTASGIVRLVGGVWRWKGL